jgi:hypothetical protein
MTFHRVGSSSATLEITGAFTPGKPGTPGTPGKSATPGDDVDADIPLTRECERFGEAAKYQSPHLGSFNVDS